MEGDLMFTPKLTRGISIYIIFSVLSGSLLGLFIFHDVHDDGGAKAAIIYVDSLGGGQYTSIQAAIDNASVGDTIYVANGTYNESVLINKSNINLIGNSSSECKINYQYEGSDYVNDYAAAINVTAKRVNITGFNITVTGNYTYGIRLNSTKSSNANIFNNNITVKYWWSGNNHCIYLDRSLKANIENNTLTTAGWPDYGIYLYGSSENDLKNNKIKTTGFNGYAVCLVESSNKNNITGNIINTTGYMGIGIYLEDANNTIVSQNTITTANSNAVGIYLDRSKANILENNNINTQIGSAIRMDYSPYNNVTGNTFKTFNVGSYCFYLYGSSNNNLTNNNIYTYGASSYGINFNGGSYNNITNNTINQQSENGYGIYLYGSSNTNLTNNSIQNPKENGYGVNIFWSSFINLTENNINVTGYGIYFNNVIQANLSSNNLTNCGIMIYGDLLVYWNTHNIDILNTIDFKPVYYYKDTSGVTVPANAGEVILANTTFIEVSNQNFHNSGVLLGFTNNSNVNDSEFQNCSIHLTNSCNNNLNKNNLSTITGSEYGIYLRQDSINNTITENTIDTSGRSAYGIYLYDFSDDNHIKNNTIYTSGNDGVAIFLFMSSDNEFAGNKISTSNVSGFGIFVNYQCNDNLLNSNSIITSGYSGYGLFFERSSNNYLINNNIQTFGDNSYGIYLGSSSNNNIVGNDINTRGNSSPGIYLISNSARNDIIDNDVVTEGSMAQAISVLYSSMNTLMNNTIRTTLDNSTGIYLIGSSNNNLIGNLVTTLNQRSHGIYVYQSSVENTISENIIFTNGIRAYGMLIEYYSSENKILNNSIVTTGLRGYGINIYERAYTNLLFENYITTHGERGYGLYFYQAAYNELIDNIITTAGSRADGIYLQQATENTLSKNRINISGNAYGIFLYQDSNDNRMSENDIFTTGDGGYGILIDESNNTYIENCEITTQGVTFPGIYLDGNFATISNSTISTAPSCYDLTVVNNGILTIINSTFQNIECVIDSGGILIVKNYLRIQVYELDEVTPIAGVEVEVNDNGEQVYATNAYGGSDLTTDTNGKLENIAVTDRWYNHNYNPTENTTDVKVLTTAGTDWEEVRTNVDMNTSHTETFIKYANMAPYTPPNIRILRIPGTNSLNITWGQTFNTVKYTVYHMKTGNWSILRNLTYPQNWTLDENLIDDIWHYYRLQAWSKYGLSSAQSITFGYFLTDLTPPAIPNGLEIKPVPNGDALKISWNLNTDDTKKYDIRWISPTSGLWEQVINSSQPANNFIFSHDRLMNGSEYIFKIRAWDKVDLSSQFSSPVSVIHRDYLVPAQPMDLTAKTISNSVISLHWNSSTHHDVVEYHIYINDSSSRFGRAYRLLAKVNALTYEATNLIENTTYHFVATAVDEANNTSPYSMEASNTTLPHPPGPFVIETIPDNDSNNISIESDVMIIFSSPMNTLSVEKVLKISPDTPFIPIWSNNNRVLEIIFYKNFNYNTTYTITIDSALGINGNSLRNVPFILIFATTVDNSHYSITITSPSSNYKVKPNEWIIVIGSTSGFAPNTQITLTLDNETQTGEIGNDGKWIINIMAPSSAGNYTLTVSVDGNIDSTTVIVEEPEEIDGDGADDDKVDGIFGTNPIVILGIILVIIIIIIMLILTLLSRKRAAEIPDTDDEMDEFIEKMESEAILELHRKKRRKTKPREKIEYWDEDELEWDEE
jgi:parallel beta-helix repeat protein